MIISLKSSSPFYAQNRKTDFKKGKTGISGKQMDKYGCWRKVDKSGKSATKPSKKW